jgi:hypothetical protein
VMLSGIIAGERIVVGRGRVKVGNSSEVTKDGSCSSPHPGVISLVVHPGGQGGSCAGGVDDPWSLDRLKVARWMVKLPAGDVPPLAGRVPVALDNLMPLQDRYPCGSGLLSQEVVD